MVRPFARVLLALVVATGAARAAGPVTTLQNAITTNIAPNNTGAITAGVLQSTLNTIIPVFNSMGTWDANGIYTPSIPAATTGLVTLVPQRVATGSGPVSTAATDFLVCVNGPTEVDLELSPPAGTTHVIKDCRAAAGAGISIVPTGGNTIDRGPSYVMTNQAQSVTITYTSLGWSIY